MRERMALDLRTSVMEFVLQQKMELVIATQVISSQTFSGWDCLIQIYPM